MADTTDTRRIRVLFFFVGLQRRTLLAEIEKHTSPDSGLLGMNYLSADQAFDVQYLDLVDLPAWVKRVVPFQVLPLVHLPRILRCDVVIATDGLSLGYIASLLSSIGVCRTRWVYIALNSSVLMRRYAQRPLRLFLLRTFWSTYEKIVYLSETQKQDFLRIGVSERKLQRIALGVDTDFWSSGDAAIREEELIVSVGRDAGRDHMSLLEALRKLPYRAVIATSRHTIPQNAEIPKTVELKYNVDPTEVRNLYLRAAVVAIILKEEGTPDGSDCTGQTVILEALAAGKAIIATKRAWLDEYLEDGKEYVSVRPHDPEGIARTIRELMADPTRRASLAQAGSARVRASYTSQAFARALGVVLTGIGH